MPRGDNDEWQRGPAEGGSKQATSLNLFQNVKPFEPKDLHGDKMGQNHFSGFPKSSETPAEKVMSCVSEVLSALVFLFGNVILLLP